MKKLTVIILIFCSLSIFSQGVKKGNFIIDGYYGFPNLFTAILKTTYQNTGTTVEPQYDFKIGGLGPVGGRFEYLVSDKMGIGLDGNYTNTYASWRGDAGGGTTYNYKVSFPRFRIMPRFNFHFVKNAEKIDGYFAVAAGYGSWSAKFETNDPDYEFAKINSLIPIAFRTAVGMRFFFIDNLGINMEIGLGGGPILAGGLSAKF